MIELPEAVTLAKQMNLKLKGKKISNVVAAFSPHKFAWYHGDPQKYNSLLKGKVIDKASGLGGMVELKVGDANILLGDGVGLRHHMTSSDIPKKHQLLVELSDNTFLSASIQMYGGISCFLEGTYNNKYYIVARDKPSPVTAKFSQSYFTDLISAPELHNKSAKFVLATEQRIPGLGNGVLQDILFTAKIHPKRKISSLSKKEKEGLFNSIKSVLKDMSKNGGRDTEKDLFGNPGAYITRCSKNTVGKSCPECKTKILKESYMGGSIYYCKNCQKLP